MAFPATSASSTAWSRAFSNTTSNCSRPPAGAAANDEKGTDVGTVVQVPAIGFVPSLNVVPVLPLFVQVVCRLPVHPCI